MGHRTDLLPGNMARLACALLLLALASAASAAEVTEIKAWAQCGGTSCTGGGCPDGPWESSQCAEGFKCLRMTAFFWQCKPIASLFSQCGGNGGACKGGSLCGDKAWAACPGGSTCLRQSPFYWQCVADGEIENYKNSFRVQSFNAADAAKPKAAAAAANAAAAAKKPQPAAAGKPANAHPAAPTKVIAGPGAVQPAKPAAAAAEKPVQAPQAAPGKAGTVAGPVLPGAVAPPQVTRAAPRPLWPWSRAAGNNKP